MGQWSLSRNNYFALFFFILPKVDIIYLSAPALSVPRCRFLNKAGSVLQDLSLEAISFPVQPRPLAYHTSRAGLVALGSTGLWWEFRDQSCMQAISAAHYSGLISSDRERERVDNLITQQLLMVLLERRAGVSTAVITLGPRERREEALVRLIS